MQVTEIDRALLRRADSQRLVTYEGSRPRTRYGEEARLQGLAEKVGTRTWRFLPALRQAHLAGDIIKSRARHLARLSDPRMPLVVTAIDPGTRITGRGVGTRLSDELRDRRYLLIEGADGSLHYIAQPPA